MSAAGAAAAALEAARAVDAQQQAAYRPRPAVEPPRPLSLPPRGRGRDVPADRAPVGRVECKPGRIELHAEAVSLPGPLEITALGRGLVVREGPNAKQGVVRLVDGSAIVECTTLTASSRVFVCSQQDGGTPGWLRVSVIEPGTDGFFEVVSSSAQDESVVAYWITEGS